MTDRVLLLIAGSCILLALTLASCGDRERQFAEKAISPTAEKAMFLTEYAHVCGSSLRRQDFCPTDFERLAVSPISADGKKVWILGYLAIDNGQVVIFATEEDFLDLQYGRSISVHGTREQLVKLFSEFGYKKVRISGQFRALKARETTGWGNCLGRYRQSSRFHELPYKGLNQSKICRLSRDFWTDQSLVDTY